MTPAMGQSVEDLAGGILNLGSPFGAGAKINSENVSMQLWKRNPDAADYPIFVAEVTRFNPATTEIGEFTEGGFLFFDVGQKSGDPVTTAATCLVDFAPDQPLPDSDEDGVPDVKDNCPTVPNRDQRDSDGIVDACRLPYRPFPCDMELTCEYNEDDASQVLTWTLDAPDPECNCTTFKIVDGITGDAITEVSDRVSTASIPCDILSKLTGELRLVCKGENGQDSVVTCDYSCPSPPPCPVSEAICANVPGTDLINVSWMVAPGTGTPPCDCSEIRVLAEEQLVAILPDNATEVDLSCANLPRAEGVIAVICVAADGTLRQTTCDYECIDDPCTLSVACRREETRGGPGITINWQTSGLCACESFDIVANGRTIATGNATLRTVFVLCSDLPATEGTIVVRCNGPVGTPQVEAACEYSCETCALDVTCSAVNSGGIPHIRVEWTTSGSCACDAFEILTGTGFPIRTVDASTSSLSIRCSDLPDLPDLTGTIMVRCLDAAATPRALGQCEYSCPPCSVDVT
jgi:hypothetical protein